MSQDTNEKKYSCQCGESFGSVEELNEHNLILIFLLVMSNYNINIGSTKLFVSSSDSKLQCSICCLQFTTKEEKD